VPERASAVGITHDVLVTVFSRLNITLILLSECLSDTIFKSRHRQNLTGLGIGNDTIYDSNTCLEALLVLALSKIGEEISTSIYDSMALGIGTFNALD